MMAVYTYQALDFKGKKIKGVVNAQDEHEARSNLRARGVMVTSLNSSGRILSKHYLKPDALVYFTTQFSQLIKAGLPVYESLLALEEQYRGETNHLTIAGLCESIRGGSSLSEAMASHPQSFNQLYCSMVEAGEAAGVLDVTLERLAQLLAKRQKMNKQISTTMIYPCLLGSFSLLVIFSLVTFVVPSLESLFEGRRLNGMTAFVLGASAILRTYWWVYLPMLFGVFGAVFWKSRTEEGRLMIDKLLLKLPLISTFVKQAAIARFARTMMTLQFGGVSLLRSIRIAKHVLMNRVLEEVLTQAEVKIAEGSTLSCELKKSPHIPSLVVCMLATGEESGHMEKMLDNIATMYDEELEKTLAKVMALAQPIILIVMGAIVGVVLLAVLLPLTDVTSLSSGMR